MLEFLGFHFTAFIIFLAAVHFGFFLWLLRARRRKRDELKGFLQNIVGRFSSQADIDPTASLDDQVSRYIKDCEEVLASPGREADRAALLARCEIKDERRPYLETGIDTRYNVARTAIEAYPLLGILGTLFAMALALSRGEAAAGGAGAAAAASGGAHAIAAVVQAFNSAIWTTVWGLLFAVAFMLFNAAVEEGFERMKGQRAQVQEIVRRTKQLKLASFSGERP